MQPILINVRKSIDFLIEKLWFYTYLEQSLLKLIDKNEKRQFQLDHVYKVQPPNVYLKMFNV